MQSLQLGWLSGSEGREGGVGATLKSRGAGKVGLSATLRGDNPYFICVPLPLPLRPTVRPCNHLQSDTAARMETNSRVAEEKNLICQNTSRFSAVTELKK